MHRRGLLLATLGTLAGGAAVAAAEAPERRAQASALAGQRLITGIARAGDRLVAVGQRGHVLHSGDGARSWVQAAVPANADLTAVAFADADTGYATGHDGTVLGTRDGGRRWERLLDGRQANALVLDHMQRRVAAPDAEAQDHKLLDEARRNAEAGPDKPFLDLCFTDAANGFVVGAYGLVMQTRDGGKRWEPWFDRIDNPGLLNLYAICASRGALYAAGEGGLLLKREPEGDRFHALGSPYTGSFFGIVATSAGVLAFGMRGHAYLSADDGRSWQAVATGLPASIVSGAVAGDGTVALVDQAGNIVRSADGGLHFTTSGLNPSMPLAAVAFADDKTLVLGGPRGLRSVEFKTKDS
ncbi:YCF48-related protein [Variovorax sp. J31P179]|uniref:WD40/YVTN/BNR-like repeat-containing protein n=1 Tax=Variovorax sp. J31P179 TaxID=3053508 RepID=UPI002578D737|nr:YCF48-related protein [Variovorax sp. J31P179]MDM0084913.1 YCF48-related protein [Variovorax sp. J31P179]